MSASLSCGDGLLQTGDHGHIRLRLLGQLALVLHFELGDLLAQIVQMVGCRLQLFVQKLRGRLGVPLQNFVVLLHELGHQLLHHLFGLVAVVIIEADGERRRSLDSADVGPAGAEHTNLNRFVAHVLDNIFDGPLEFFFGVKVQRGIVNHGRERATAQNLGFHGAQPLAHPLRQFAGHKPFGNLLGSNSHHRHRPVRIGPDEGHNHGNHQAGKGRTDDPGPVAAEHVDVILDIGRTPGYVHIIRCTSHNFLNPPIKNLPGRRP